MADSVFTPELNLEKPDPSQPIDVTKLNANFDKLDAYAVSAMHFAAAPIPSAAFAAAYETGITIFALSAAQATADGGWPQNASSQVWTEKTASDRASQFWFKNSGASAGLYYRQISTAANSPWVCISNATASYTPTVFAGGVAVTGMTNTGFFNTAGGFLDYSFKCVFGANFGAGSYSISLPTASPAVAGGLWTIDTFSGAGSGWVVHGGSRAALSFGMNTSPTVLSCIYTTAVPVGATSLSQGNPLTLVATDYIAGQVRIPIY